MGAKSVIKFRGNERFLQCPIAAVLLNEHLKGFKYFRKSCKFFCLIISKSPTLQLHTTEELMTNIKCEVPE